jgi:hypothetical protein
MLSIGCFVGNEAGLEYVNEIGKDYPIHVGFFKVSDYEKYREGIHHEVKIASCHLPCWFGGDWIDLKYIIEWCTRR